MKIFTGFNGLPHLLDSVRSSDADANLFDQPQDPAHNWFSDAIAQATAEMDKRREAQRASDAADSALNSGYGIEQDGLPATPTAPVAPTPPPDASYTKPDMPPEQTAPDAPTRPSWVQSALDHATARQAKFANDPVLSWASSQPGQDLLGYDSDGKPKKIDWNALEDDPGKYLATHQRLKDTQYRGLPPEAMTEVGDYLTKQQKGRSGLGDFVDKVGDVAGTAKKVATFQDDKSDMPNQNIAQELLSSGSGEQALARGVFTGGRPVDSSGLPDQPYFPVRQAVDVAAGPLNIGTAGLGGPAAGLLGPAKFVAANTAINMGLQKASEEAAALPFWKELDPDQQQAVIMALAAVGGHFAPKLVPEALRGAHDAAVGLDTKINEPAGAGQGESVTRGMTAPEPTPPEGMRDAGPPPASARLGRQDITKLSDDELKQRLGMVASALDKSHEMLENSGSIDGAELELRRAANDTINDDWNRFSDELTRRQQGTVQAPLPRIGETINLDGQDFPVIDRTSYGVQVRTPDGTRWVGPSELPRVPSPTERGTISQTIAAGPSEPAKPAPTGLEDVPTATLQSRLDALPNSGITGPDLQFLQRSIETELSRRPAEVAPSVSGDVTLGREMVPPTEPYRGGGGTADRPQEVTPSEERVTSRQFQRKPAEIRSRTTVNGETTYRAGGAATDTAGYDAAGGGGGIPPSDAGGNPPPPPEPSGNSGGFDVPERGDASGVRGKFIRAKNAVLGGSISGKDQPDFIHQGPLLNIARPENGLTLGQKASNAVRSTFNSAVKYDERVTPRMETRKSALKTLVSQANALGEQAKYTDSLFEKDAQGRWLLNDGSYMKPSAVAEWIAKNGVERTSEILTPIQADAVHNDMYAWKDWKTELVSAGGKLGKELNGYLPRGVPTRDGVGAPKGVGKMRGAITAVENDRRYHDIEEAMANGLQYPDYATAVSRTAYDLANRISALHTGKLLAPLGDAERTSIAQGKINLPGLGDRFFSTQVTDVANRSLEKPVPGWKVLSDAGNAINTTRTIMDFATPARLALQSAMSATTHPIEALKTLGNSAHSVFGKPEALGQVMADIDLKARSDPSGGTPSTRELIRDYGIAVTPSGQSNFVTKIPVLGPKVMEPSSRFMGTYANSLRLKAAADMAEVYDAAGLNTPADKLALGRAINHATGEGQKLFGGAGDGLVNFPKWLGSQVQIIKAAVSDGSIEGAYAREALLRLMGMGTLTAYAVNAAAGKDTEWKDGVPVMHIGGTDVNPWGGWGTLTKLGGKLSPVSLDKEHNAQKPDLAYALMSKGSPGVAIATQAKTGQSFNGVEPSLTNWQYLLRTIAPYTVANTGLESPTTQALNTVGIRASEPSDMSTAITSSNQIRMDEIKKQFPQLVDRNGDGSVDYADLNDAQSESVRAALTANPDWVSAQKAISDAKQAPQYPPPIQSYLDGNARINKEFADKLAALDATYASSGDAVAFRQDFNDLQTWRKTSLAENQKGLGGLASRIKGSEQKSVTEYLARNLKPEDKAVNDYYNLFDDPNVKLLNGKINFDALEKRQGDYLQGLDPNVRGYVVDRVEGFRNPKLTATTNAGTAAKLNSQGVSDYHDAKLLTSPFFQAQDDVFDKWAQRDDFLQQFANRAQMEDHIASIAKQYGVTAAQAISVVEKQSPAFRGYLAEAKRQSTVARVNDADLDRALMDWYGYAPQNPALKREVALGKRNFSTDFHAGVVP